MAEEPKLKKTKEIGISTEPTETRSTEETERYAGPGLIGGRAVENSRLMIADFKILSSLLRIFLVLGEFAHWASFERELRKSKKTKG